MNQHTDYVYVRTPEERNAVKRLGIESRLIASDGRIMMDCRTLAQLLVLGATRTAPKQRDPLPEPCPICGTVPACEMDCR